MGLERGAEIRTFCLGVPAIARQNSAQAEERFAIVAKELAAFWAEVHIKFPKLDPIVSPPFPFTILLHSSHDTSLTGFALTVQIGIGPVLSEGVE
jgi:hypothetical protein